MNVSLSAPYDRRVGKHVLWRNHQVGRSVRHRVIPPLFNLPVGLVADDGGNLDADDLLLALARQLLGATLDLAIRLLGLIFC